MFVTRKRIWAVALWILFALQVGVAIPQHHFHGFERASGEHGKLPDDCRCDLCLAYGSLDSNVDALPPAPSLHETAFAVVAAYASFEYSSALNFSYARGPPRAAA